MKRRIDLKKLRTAVHCKKEGTFDTYEHTTFFDDLTKAAYYANDYINKGWEVDLYYANEYGCRIDE